jgi:Zn-dependent peptidase ImmA (M78 family)
MDYLNSKLSKEEIKSIKREVALINQDYSIDTPGCLKEEVFDLLERVGTLIFFPFEETHLWGVYVYKNEKDYFIINTSIEIEKQVFAAAHELAHSFDLAKVNFEIVTSDLMTEYVDSKEFGSVLKKADMIANRFSAELLVGTKKLLEKFEELPETYNERVKAVLLSDIFLVPYKTIIKRFAEIGILKEQGIIEELLSVEEKEVREIADRHEACRRNYEINKETKLGGYVNKALLLYENELSTYKTLEEKLKLIEKTPEEFNIHDDSFDLYELLRSASGNPDWEDEDDE